MARPIAERRCDGRVQLDRPALVPPAVDEDRLFPSPLPVEGALLRVRAWLDQPAGVVLEPTQRHLHVLSGLLVESGTGGNLTSDAHLAALALEHHATVVTYDSDFGRFPGVKWRRPQA